MHDENGRAETLTLDITPSNVERVIRNTVSDLNMNYLYTDILVANFPTTGKTLIKSSGCLNLLQR